jgi:DNA replication protein DnaC
MMLGRIPLLVINEVGYIRSTPRPPTSSSGSCRPLERATVSVTSNKPFGRWGEVFGNATVTAAMIDGLVHHAEVGNLKGDSYRLKDKDPRGRLTTTLRGPSTPVRGSYAIGAEGAIFGRR